MVRKFVGCVLVTAGILAGSNSAWGQTPTEPQATSRVLSQAQIAAAIPQLRRKISLRLEGASMEEAFRTIARKADLQLTYNDQILPRDRKVWLTATQLRTDQALDQVLRDSGLQLLALSTGQVVVVRVPGWRATPLQLGSVVGRVTDARTTAGLPGAEVILEGTQLRAVTDGDGQYRITKVPPGEYTLRARYIGYQPMERFVKVPDGGETTADFRLERSTQVLSEIVTVGTILPTALRAVPTPVSVISSDYIQERQPRSITQVVRQAIPSAVAWDNSAFPTNTFMTVRGASSLTVGSGGLKVYVDGIEFSNLLSTPIDPGSIERLEVVRGPQAATLYGAEAINGVMLVTTKRGDSTLTRPRIVASAAAGSTESPYQSAFRQAYRAAIGGGRSTGNYYLGMGYSRTGDWYPEGGTSEPSLYGAVHVGQGAFGIDISGRYFVQNSAFNPLNPELSETGFASFSKPFFQPYQAREQGLGARLTYTPTSWWRNTLTFGAARLSQDVQQTQRRLTTPSDTLLAVFAPDENKTSVLYNTSAAFQLSSNIDGSLVVGVDHYRRSVGGFFNFATPTTVGSIAGATGTRDAITNTGYFAQAQLGLNDALFLTAGVRADDNSEFGGELGTPVLPRVGLSLVRELGATTLKLRGSYGEAIRAPNPGQKVGFADATRVFLDNTALGPERQRGWDSGIDLLFGTWGTFSATYYRQTADDLIQPVPLSAGPPPVQQYQNVGRVKNFGVELESSIHLGIANVTAQYAYSRSRVDSLPPGYAGDLRPGDQSFAVPRHTAGIQLGLTPFSRTSLGLGATYVGSWTYYDFLAQFACFGGTGPCQATNRDYLLTYPGFVKANLTLNQELTQFLSGFLSIDNLTNNHAYEVWNAIAVVGRVTMVGLRAEY